MMRNHGSRAATLVVALVAIGASVGFLWHEWHADPPHERRQEWRAATVEERAAAVASVTGQLDAFKAADFKRAVTYQSEGLKRNFPSTALFRKMMENAYPAFLRYRRAEFGPARCDRTAEHLEVPVTLTTSRGETVKAVYMLIRESGDYRVEGVEGGRLEAPPVRKRHLTAT